MTLEEKVRALIVGQIPALADRIYFTYDAPDKPVTPYAVGNLQSQPPLSTHDQPLYGTRPWLFQIQVYSKTYGQGRLIAGPPSGSVPNIQSLIVGQRSDDGLQHILLEPPGMTHFFENDTQLHTFTVFFQAMESFT